MIEIDIPDFDRLSLAHLVLDYNGTLAFDGRLLSGVADLLERLAKDLRIHIITADTFGSVKQVFAGTGFTVHVLSPGNEAEGKAEYVRQLGSMSSVCIGNGRNDRLMLGEAMNSGEGDDTLPRGVPRTGIMAIRLCRSTPSPAIFCAIAGTW